jgi:hypothetical protein
VCNHTLINRYQCTTQSSSWPLSDTARPPVTTLPLGFGKGQWDDIERTATSMNFNERKHTWAFVGQMKSDRAEMLGHFSRVDGSYPSHSAPRNELMKVYGDAWFVPAARGWSVLDVFRIYEALYAGAIPVVVGSDDEINQTFSYLGDELRALIVFAPSWDVAANEVNAMLKDGISDVKVRARATHAAWHAFIERLKLRIARVLSSHDGRHGA